MDSFSRNWKLISSLQDRLIPTYMERVLEQHRQLQKLAIGFSDRFGSEFIDPDRSMDAIASFAERHLGLLESSKRWADAIAIIQKELPRRGWYLTGREDACLTTGLARLAKDQNWDEVDRILIEQASALTLDVDAFCAWLNHRFVPRCCVERVRIFMKARDKRDHEVATLVGVPLIDELCRALYHGKDFTTKRGQQPKPQIACTTSSSTVRLSLYCKGFVDSFGLIHDDVDPSRLEDQDYFNRSAIVHGLMRRGFGPKDSAKAFMALMFLVFAIDDESMTEEHSDVDDVAVTVADPP